jgi:hypothetical protein
MNRQKIGHPDYRGPGGVEVECMVNNKPQNLEEYRHFNFPWKRTNSIRKFKYLKCQTWEMAKYIKLYYVLLVLTIKRNAIELKGNKLAAVSRHS